MIVRYRRDGWNFNGEDVQKKKKQPLKTDDRAAAQTKCDEVQYQRPDQRQPLRVYSIHTVLCVCLSLAIALIAY